MNNLLIQFSATVSGSMIKCADLKQLFIELNSLWSNRFILGTDCIIDKEPHVR